jgi:hypothetical protein
MIFHVFRASFRAWPGHNQAWAQMKKARSTAGLYFECVIRKLLLKALLHTSSDPSRTTADTVRESAGGACSERWSIVWRLDAGLFSIARAAPGFVPAYERWDGNLLRKKAALGGLLTMELSPTRLYWMRQNSKTKSERQA